MPTIKAAGQQRAKREALCEHPSVGAGSQAWHAMTHTACQLPNAPTSLAPISGGRQEARRGFSTAGDIQHLRTSHPAC